MDVVLWDVTVTSSTARSKLSSVEERLWFYFGGLVEVPVPVPVGYTCRYTLDSSRSLSAQAAAGFSHPHLFARPIPFCVKLYSSKD